MDTSLQKSNQNTLNLTMAGIHRTQMQERYDIAKVKRVAVRITRQEKRMLFRCDFE
ncbi:MAG: hypothetical protein ACLTS6_17610 [Anaerobutyricum sp.]